MLSEYIRRIHFTTHLPKLKRLASDSFLHPKGVSRNMAQLPKALPGAYADGRAAVGPHPDGQLMPEVVQEALLSEC